MRQIVLRVAASILGGWAFVWGFATLGIALLLAAGMTYADAQLLVYLLAFLIYVAAICFAFAARTAGRVWLVLLGGGATMTAVAWWLTRRHA